MQFSLVIGIFYSVGSCHDDRQEEIIERFEAKSRKAAIDQAKIIVKNYHDKYCGRTEYEMVATLFVIKPIWQTSFEEEKDAIPATAARPASPAHFEEKSL